MDESYRLTTLLPCRHKPPKSVLWPNLTSYAEWCDRQVQLMWCKGMTLARVHVEIVNDVRFCCVSER